MNQKFQNALKGELQAVPPIWFMRQAGRYHKHYQNLRAKHSFMELCKNPDLAAEVTLGPIEDFDFDVAILFSDLLFPLEAMGMGLKYEDTGPELGWRLDASNIKKLSSVKDSLPHLQFQKLAMQKAREVLPGNKSLIGFVGGPWTLFAYAVEGAHKGSLQKSKQSLSLYPHFCETLLPLLKANIELQFEGGAEVVMIFDTAAGELSPLLFNDLIVPGLQSLAEIFPKKLAYYIKGATQDHYLAQNWKQDLWAGFGYDHRFDLANVLKTPHAGIVQGNFDQNLMFLPEDEFKKAFLNYLEPLRKLSVEERRGWVCGLGHGVLPKTPESHVRYIVQTVREVLK